MKFFARAIVSWIACTGFLMLASVAISQPLQMGLYGPRQLGMGMTAVALPVDASSAFFNPGGMVWLPRRAHFQLGVHTAQPVTRFVAGPPSVYSINMDTLLLSPISIYGVWKGKPGGRWGKFAFGVSVNNPYQAASRWDDDWKGKYISQEYAINTLFIQPTVAMKLGKRWGIGAGMVYALGNLLSRRAVQIDGPNGTEGSVQFSGTGTGLGVNLGFSFKVSETVQLGMVYRSPISIPVDSGQAIFEVPAAVSAQWPDQAFYTLLPLPTGISFGLGYKPQERWRLGVDISWAGWARFDSLKLDLTFPNSQLQQFAARNYTNTFNLHLGGEYSQRRFSGRAGLYFRGTPVQQGFISPEFPDANRIGLTAGVGLLLFQAFSLDVSYAYEYTGDRTAILQEANFTGIYRSTTSALGIGIGYVF